MVSCRISVLIALLFYYMHGLVCQDISTFVLDPLTEQNEFIYDPNEPYCYSFTWFSIYNNKILNGTCKDLNLKDTPCMQPFVITNNGTEPNLDILWRDHRDKVLCRPASSESCIKYVYYLNENVVNTTYMCAKAISINEKTPPSGCYSQYLNAYEIKACMCKSEANEYQRPCNAADVNKISVFLMFIVAFYNFILT